MINTQDFTLQGHTYFFNSYGGISQRNPTAYSYDQEYNETYNTAAYREASAKLMAIRMKQVIKACNGFPSSLLDFGYGNGSFLDLACKSVLDCKGFDIASTDYHKGKKWERVDWIDRDNPPEVATFWDSLEHCVNPEEEIKAIGAKYVCISLPWMPPIEYMQDWHHLKPNEHLHHFNANALEVFMNDCDYELLWLGNHEDAIRKPRNERNNILSASFVKL